MPWLEPYGGVTSVLFGVISCLRRLKIVELGCMLGLSVRE